MNIYFDGLHGKYGKTGGSDHPLPYFSNHYKND